MPFRLTDGEKTLLLALYRWNIAGVSVLRDDGKSDVCRCRRVPDYLLDAEFVGTKIDSDLTSLQTRGLVRECGELYQFGRWQLSDGRILECGWIGRNPRSYCVTIDGERVVWGNRVKAYGLTAAGVAEAERFLPARTSQSRKRRARTRPGGAPKSLTEHQQKAWSLRARGKSYQEIGEELGISKTAAHKAVRAATRKLECVCSQFGRNGNTKPLADWIGGQRGRVPRSIWVQKGTDDDSI